MTRAAALLAVLALGAPASTVAAVSYGGSLGVAYDSNAGNAGEAHDVRDVSLAFASAGASREWRFGKYTAVQLQGALFAEQATGLEDLSNAGLGARIRLLRKPGKGFYTPVLAAWFGAGAREYGSAIRDGADYRAGISATEPLTTALQLRLEVQRVQREASGRVFDLGHTSSALNVDWLAAPRLTVYAGARYNDGQFAVTADGEGDISPKREHLYLEQHADAIEADPAFGEDWWAFRLEGHAVVTTLGFNLALTPDLALDAQVQRSVASTSGFDYARALGSLGFLFRW
jgi:hypothetical protein